MQESELAGILWPRYVETWPQEDTQSWYQQACKVPMGLLLKIVLYIYLVNSWPYVMYRNGLVIKNSWSYIWELETSVNSKEFSLFFCSSFRTSHFINFCSHKPLLPSWMSHVPDLSVTFCTAVTKYLLKNNACFKEVESPAAYKA